MQQCLQSVIESKLKEIEHFLILYYQHRHCYLVIYNLKDVKEEIQLMLTNGFKIIIFQMKHAQTILGNQKNVMLWQDARIVFMV